ncbi:type II secretion system inner membrane protein GspF [Candidatus Ichthyocystis hellenicum]|uniref:type II secretion system inner membrane protein GspF n=1 Tax=Candidatus Ichthyocystis hellenicum TaxID=1561003 RepID=UPI000B87CCCF|nr:type II secretion system inner membrane protein GspF [Candidatus Ichthyocystis hellenicum]
MPVYKYEAIDTLGKSCKGVVESDSERSARQDIVRQGLTLIEIKGIGQTSGRIFLFREVLSSSDQVLFARQLCILLSAGLTIEDSLQALFQQAEKKYFRSLILFLRSEILEGSTLADALLKRKKDFPIFFSMLVRAGELSGHLPEILSLLADYLENRQNLFHKVLGALLYPAIVTVFSLFVIILMMVYVVPQVVGVFAHTKHQLPLLTRILIGVSGFLKAYWMWLVGMLGFLAWQFLRLLRSESKLFKFHSFLIKVPIVGKLVLALNTVRFSSTLAILLKGGVSLLQALAVSGSVIQNLPLKRLINRAEVLVSEGATLAAALSTEKFLPPIFLHLISNGEKTGQLPMLLDKASLILQRDAERRIMLFANLLEPLLILFTGGMVLTIVLAILMPILDMNTLIK